MVDQDSRIQELTEALEKALENLEQFRLLVNEGGVPRYTVTPGAALNTLVGWVDRTITRTRAALEGTK